MIFIHVPCWECCGPGFLFSFAVGRRCQKFWVMPGRGNYFSIKPGSQQHISCRRTFQFERKKAHQDALVFRNWSLSNQLQRSNLHDKNTCSSNTPTQYQTCAKATTMHQLINSTGVICAASSFHFETRISATGPWIIPDCIGTSYQQSATRRTISQQFSSIYPHPAAPNAQLDSCKSGDLCDQRVGAVQKPLTKSNIQQEYIFCLTVGYACVYCSAGHKIADKMWDKAWTLSLRRNQNRPDRMTFHVWVLIGVCAKLFLQKYFSLFGFVLLGANSAQNLNLRLDKWASVLLLIATHGGCCPISGDPFHQPRWFLTQRHLCEDHHQFSEPPVFVRWLMIRKPVISTSNCTPNCSRISTCFR